MTKKLFLLLLIPAICLSQALVPPHRPGIVLVGKKKAAVGNDSTGAPLGSASHYFVATWGSDANTGHLSSAPWQTITKVNTLTFNPGDSIFFRSGQSWTATAKQGIYVQSSGTSGSPIVLTSYGSGAKPYIKNPLLTSDSLQATGITVTGNYVTVNNFLLDSCRYSGVWLQGANGTAKNCEMKNSGSGGYLDGRNGMFTHNTVHDLVMTVNDASANNDFGAVGAWVRNSQCTVSYNTFDTCFAVSHDYGYDGGMVEIFSQNSINVDSCSIDHNVGTNTMDFIEVGGDGSGRTRRATISYNSCRTKAGIAGTDMSTFHTSGTFHIGLDRLTFNNNTVYVPFTGADGNTGMVGWTAADSLTDTMVVMQNNIFACNNARFRYGTNKGMPSGATNVFYRTDAGTDPALTSAFTLENPNTTSLTNFALLNTSPAINAGTNLSYTSDVLGNPIVGNPDIGAYEYQTAGFLISASAGNGGTITPTGYLLVPTGNSQTYGDTASANYSLDSLTVDGVKIAPVSTYTFSNVQTTHTIVAAYKAYVGPTLALPFTDSASTGSSLSSNWNYGGTWTISGGKFVNTPGLGAEILSDPGLEATYTAGLCTSLGNWYNGGDPHYAQGNSVHGGTKAQNLSATGTNGAVYITPVSTIGVWYQFSVWAKRISGTSNNVRMDAADGGVSPVMNAASYTQYFTTYRGAFTNNEIRPARSFSGAGDSVAIDDISFKTITVANMFATVNTDTQNVSVEVAVTAANGVTAGVVLNLDNPINPQNFVVGYIRPDATFNDVELVLEKCVAGTWTNKIAISGMGITASGQILKVTKTCTTYALYWNGSQVGTNQTISDAGIVSNKRHGLFSTNPTITLDNFYIKDN